MVKDVTAVILAGGQSRRMGQNKALLRLQPDGPCLIELVVQAVTPLTDHLLISTNTPTTYTWLGQPLLADSFFDGGPLAGLEAGLAASTTEYVLLVGCDMPFLVTDLLRHLISLRGTAAAVVPLNCDGQVEPLCAVYHQACLPTIRARLTAGQLQMRAWLADIPVRFVPSTELLLFDSDLRSFRNFNTPTDLTNT